MVASTRITNSEVFAFIAVLIFMLLSRKVLSINRKTTQIMLLFKEIANFTGNLQQNYKY